MTFHRIPPRLTRYLNQRFEQWSYVGDWDNYVDIQTPTCIVSYNLDHWRA